MVTKINAFDTDHECFKLISVSFKFKKKYSIEQIRGIQQLIGGNSIKLLIGNKRISSGIYSNNRTNKHTNISHNFQLRQRYKQSIMLCECFNLLRFSSLMSLSCLVTVYCRFAKLKKKKFL